MNRRSCPEYASRFAQVVGRARTSSSVTNRAAATNPASPYARSSPDSVTASSGGSASSRIAARSFSTPYPNRMRIRAPDLHSPRKERSAAASGRATAASSEPHGSNTISESARPKSSPGASASASRPSSAFGKPPRDGLAAIRREASRRPSAVASTPITRASGLRAATARTYAPSPVPKSTCSARYSAARSASHQRSTQCSFLPVTRCMAQDTSTISARRARDCRTRNGGVLGETRRPRSQGTLLPRQRRPPPCRARSCARSRPARTR